MITTSFVSFSHSLDGPSSDFIWPHGEVVDEGEALVARLEDAGEAALVGWVGLLTHTQGMMRCDERDDLEMMRWRWMRERELCIHPALLQATPIKQQKQSMNQARKQVHPSIHHQLLLTSDHSCSNSTEKGMMSPPPLASTSSLIRGSHLYTHTQPKITSHILSPTSRHLDPFLR